MFALQGYNENLITGYPQFLWVSLEVHRDDLWMAGGQPVRIAFKRLQLPLIYPNWLIKCVDFSCFGYECRQIVGFAEH